MMIEWLQSAKLITEVMCSKPSIENFINKTGPVVQAEMRRDLYHACVSYIVHHVAASYRLKVEFARCMRI